MGCSTTLISISSILYPLGRNESVCFIDGQPSLLGSNGLVDVEVNQEYAARDKSAEATGAEESPVAEFQHQLLII